MNNRIKLKPILFYIASALFPISISAIAMLEPSSVFTFLLVLLATLSLHKIIFGYISKDIFITYSYYSFFAILFATFHLISYGQYFDLGGNPAEIGGDDLRYSTEVLTGVSFWRGHKSLLPYSNLLRLFCYPLSLVKVPNYIDLLIINILAISFVPIFASKLSMLLFRHKAVAHVSFILTLFCPILLVNSVLLYRDGWSALFFIATIYYLYKKRYLLALTFLVFEFYIRIGGGLILIFISVVIYLNQFLKYRAGYEIKVVVAMFLFGCIFVAIEGTYAYILSYLSEKVGEEVIFREVFFEQNVVQEAAKKGVDSGMVALYRMPFFIRFIGGSLFFLIAPTFSLNYLYSVHGVFWLKQAVMLVFPFMMLCYIVWFIRGGVWAIKKKDREALLIFGVFIFAMIALSQLSLQIRHKAMFMPVFYVLVSYGVYFKEKKGTQYGFIVSLLMFASQFAYMTSKLI